MLYLHDVVEHAAVIWFTSTLHEVALVTLGVVSVIIGFTSLWILHGSRGMH